MGESLTLPLMSESPGTYRWPLEGEERGEHNYTSAANISNKLRDAAKNPGAHILHSDITKHSMI